ncbi:MAG: CFI-box-CTERM domain-containing protein [Syntrophaceae bacterium]
MKKIMFPAFFCSVIAVLLLLTGVASALERGAILYHSSKNDEIYGRDAKLLLPESIKDIALQDLKSGHVGLYIGEGNKIIHAVTPTVELTDSVNFIPQKDLNAGCRYIGAKVPANYNTWSELDKDQLILLAKLQVGVPYDIQFLHQKGPHDKAFTCVGLVEFIFEQVGYDITPSGYYNSGSGGRTYIQTYNSESTLGVDWKGENTFSQTVEFSKIEHPLTEIVHLNIGISHNGERYLFFPYTQYLQTTTVAVTTDVPVSGGGSGDKDEDDDDGGSCFIATAAYGSYLHPHVQVLRTLRDRYLLSSRLGRSFVAAYYHYSPPMADFIGRHDTLKAAARVALLPLIGLTFLMLWIGPIPVLAMLAFLLLLPVVLLSRNSIRS